MKTILFSAAVVVGFATLAQAQKHTLEPQPPAPPAPPPVFQAPPPSDPVLAKPPAAARYVYEQRLMGSPQVAAAAPAPAPVPSPVPATLVTPEQAQGIINRFKESYSKMGNPRLLVYVNRELMDKGAEQSEGPLAKGNSDTGRNDANAPSEAPSDKAVHKNTDQSEPSLADKQTTRDVERLFGRPLRMAGATLIDQRIATQMDQVPSSDHKAAATEIDQARKDREALSKIADVALEILVSSRSIVVPGANGENYTYSVPDIQATAIRLSDSKIIGQATATDIVGQGQAAARVAGTFGVREIAEATALSLMEDMVSVQ